MEEVEILISERERKAQELRAALASVEADLQALYRTRAMIKGETDSDAAARMSSKASLPDLIEQLLRQSGELHANEIVQRLKPVVETTKQAVTASIVRYIAKHKRFKRVGPNRFALRDTEGEVTDMK
ncbi:MAG TPA: hypothetical protein VM911_08555 [Pyrinomonadaceae bacterium]|jgi:hypothetical protein|nr:hypothetical protein [Pyrinomonadaceae bacterium]